MKANELRKLVHRRAHRQAEKALKEELFNLRFQMATGSLTNSQRVRECKKDVARIKTLLCERRAQGSRVRVKGGYHRGNHQRLSQDPHRRS